MGVLPPQFKFVDARESLGLVGDETSDVRLNALVGLKAKPHW